MMIMEDNETDFYENDTNYLDMLLSSTKKKIKIKRKEANKQDLSERNWNPDDGFLKYGEDFQLSNENQQTKQHTKINDKYVNKFYFSLFKNLFSLNS